MHTTTGNKIAEILRVFRWGRVIGPPPFVRAGYLHEPAIAIPEKIHQRPRRSTSDLKKYEDKK